jgi:hypothetical protein
VVFPVFLGANSVDPTTWTCHQVVGSTEFEESVKHTATVLTEVVEWKMLDG